jgi:NifB/MoaA-like Fe-S oxidoreductase
VLRNPDAPDVMSQLRRLTELDIEVHTQIVVTPGLNDGLHLDRSIGDLSGLYPSTRSVSVVPVGLTRFHRGKCRVHTDAEMRLVFEQVTAWQVWLRERLGVNFAYLSDEWYLRLGEDVPETSAYDGLDLTENGVGLVRRFLEIGDWRLPALISNLQSPTLVTGILFAPILRSVTAADVISITNHFFGEMVTVAGLLMGQDVIAQLQRRELGDVVVLPAAMFGGPEGQTLDGMWPQEIGEALGREVVVG